jgi:hypothetical protein
MKRDPNQQSRYIYDENGHKEVSEQIMNSYNSGFIDQGTANANQNDYAEAEDMQ